MKPEIKEIIDDLIEFNKLRKPNKTLKNVFEKQGEINVYSLTNWILLWHKLNFLDLESPDKYDLSGHEKLQKRFEKFFEDCSAIKKVFSFHGSYIGWSDDIPEDEQKEIRDYIHKNHKVQVRIRRNRTSY